MTLQKPLEDFLDKRIRRTVAIVLGVAERQLALSPEEMRILRNVVRDQVYDLRTIVADLLESLDTGQVLVNELWLEKIDQIHRAVTTDPLPVSAPSRTVEEPEAPKVGDSRPFRERSSFGGGRPVVAP